MGRRRRAKKKPKSIAQRKVELLDHCRSDDLSLETLKEKTNGLSPGAVVDSLFLHTVVGNEKVTHEIVEYIVSAYPEAVGKKRGTHGMYPLHLACANRHCPGSAIKLLAESNPDVLSLGGVDNELPLHRYMSRGSSYDISTVGCLVEHYPDALTTKRGKGRHPDISTPLQILCEKGEEISLDLVRLLVDENEECLKMRGGGHLCLPVHALLYNARVSINIDVINFLVEHTPSSLMVTWQGGYGGNILHAACSNENVTLEIVQKLLDIEGGDGMVSGTTMLGNQYPIHILCKNAGLDDEISLEVLKLLADKCPEALRRADRGYLPIHHACIHKSVECCQFLVEEYPECVEIKTGGDSHRLPFHLACAYGSLALVEYLSAKCPSSIHKQTYDDGFDRDEYDEYIDEMELEEPLAQGNYPLHLAVMSDHPERKDIVEFLAGDGALAKVVGKWRRLPLHVACASSLNLGVVKAIFKANPSAIHTKDFYGRLPIHYAMGCNEYRTWRFRNPPAPVVSSKRQTTLVLDYLIDQLPYSLDVRDGEGTGRVCAHYACGTTNALQKVTAIGNRCTDSFFARHRREGLPIHVACAEGEIAVVKYMARIVPDVLDMEHTGIGLPLACAKTPELFQFLLSERYYAPAFHEVLADEDAREEVDPLLTKFIGFSQNDSEGEDFQRDVWKRGDSGAYPLHWVFYATESQEIISSLISLHPAALEKQDKKGWLPLHHALHCEAPEDVIRDLIERHPDAMHIADKKGLTPMHVAAGSTTTTHSEDTIFALSRVLVASGDPEAIWRARDRRGWLPLHHAIRNNSSLRIIQLMVDALRDVDIAPDGHGSTPVHLACNWGCELDVMECLVDLLGPDVALSLDNNGHTPAHVACRWGIIPVKALRYLIELAPTALTAADNRGELPLHKACRGGHAELITELMAANASAVTKRNATNELPIFILCKRSGKEVEVLESVEYAEAIWQLLLAYPETVLGTRVE